jgi:hypothetical protein
VVDLDRLERVLVHAARERRPLTYGQLLAYFGLRVGRITVGALCRDLGRVERRRAGEGWPDLACLVVRKSDGLPGEGYFVGLRAEGAYAGPSEGPQAATALRARQERAFAWAAAAGADGEQAEACSPDEPQTFAVWPLDSRCM